MGSKSNISPVLSLFSVLLACHLLNFSIDSKDLHPSHVAEDLSYNDIESILEFTFEVLLGFDNAFFEYDEADGEDGRQHGFYLFFLQPLPVYDVKIGPLLAASYGLPGVLSCVGSLLIIQSPPPEAAYRAA